MSITEVRTPNSALLSPASRPVIEATLPVVGENLGPITELFYRNLFDDVPALQRDLFNQTNQENGHQQKALAGAIAAFATLLITEDAPPIDQVMSRIAAKHASLGVVPVQYDLVHGALFRAIVSVLGEAVTPEVASAWDEVYWLMANSLIKQEGEMYKKAGVSPGHIWTALTVIDRKEESPGTHSFTLQASESGTTSSFEPGQYISVSVIYADGSRQIRQYTLCEGDAPNTWQFIVKAVPGGRVSNKLIAEAQIGYPLVVSLPSGSAYLVQDSKPITLVSSSVGSTLSTAILQNLAKNRDGRPVKVIHLDDTKEDHAQLAKMEGLIDALPNSSMDTIYDLNLDVALEKIRNLVWDKNSHVYLCGSPSFMRQVRKIAVIKGINPDHIHYEAFTPGSWLGFD